MPRVSQAISSDFFSRECAPEPVETTPLRHPGKERFYFVCLRQCRHIDCQYEPDSDRHQCLCRRKKDLTRGQLVWPEMKILSPPECLEELA